MIHTYSKFYIVWREGGDTPRKKHESKELAIKEADRLALLNPEVEFHVLQVIGTCVKQETIWVYYE